MTTPNNDEQEQEIERLILDNTKGNYDYTKLIPAINQYVKRREVQVLKDFHDWIGTQPEYQNITLSTLQRFWDLHYKPNLLAEALKAKNNAE